MRMIRHAVSAGALLAALSPPAIARDKIVVRPALSVTQWSAKVAGSLERGIDHPRRGLRHGAPEGVATVSFDCSDDGLPANVAISHRSGNRTLDRAALRAVRRIKNLHPLPEGVGHDQRYSAVIVFATSEESRARRMSELARDGRLPRPSGSSIALVGPVPVTAR